MQNKLPIPTPATQRLDSKPATQQAVQHEDSIQNAIVGLGYQADKALQTRPGGIPRLSDTELTDIWESEGLGKRIIKAVPDDSIRPWFTVKGDTDGELAQAAKELGLQQQLAEACYWARLYGGSGIFMGIEDGQDPTKPQNATPRPIAFLKVYGVPDIILSGLELDNDPKSKRYEEPIYYPCYNLNGISTNIHHTRFIPIKGELVAAKRTYADFRRRYWGISILQAMWTRIAGLVASMQGMDNMLLEFSIAVFKLQGLAQLAASGRGDALMKRMATISMSKSLLRGVMLDATEDFTRVSTPLAGVSDILEKSMLMVSAVSGIPITRLFGRAPAGLNATGEADIRLYYDECRVYQTQTLTPAIMPILRQINANLKVVPDEKLEVIWGNPYAPTEAETATLRKTVADTDKLYVDMQVLNPEEIRESRFGGDEWSSATKLDPGMGAPKPPEAEVPAKKPVAPAPAKKEMPEGKK